MRIMVTVQGSDAESDLVLDCDEDTPVEELSRVVCAEMGLPPTALVVPQHEGTQTEAGVGAGCTVGDLDLEHGMRVGVGRRPTTSADLDTDLQLHVVGGPGAGTVFRLTLGEHEVGRTATLSWRDHSLSRHHCRIVVTADGVGVVDLGSSNGTFLDADRCAEGEERPWKPGVLLEIGDSQVELRRGRESDASTEVTEPGWRAFLRPPRIPPVHTVPKVTVPKPPTKNKRRKLSPIAIMVPMIFGVAMAVALRNPLFLMFAFLSPVMLAGNYVADRRGDAKEYKEAKETYETELAAAREQLQREVVAEERRLRRDLPDAADTLLTCALPGRRLWERRRGDEDAFTLRVASTDLPAGVIVDGEKPSEVPQVHSVPVGVELRHTGVLGLAGPGDDVAGSLRWALAQLAAYHAPRDLQLVFLTSDEPPGGDPSDWDWVRWLPHLGFGADALLVGNDEETRKSRVAAVNEAMTERRGEKQSSSRVDPASFPAIVLVLHGYSRLRTVPGLATLLDRGPEVGIYTICTDAAERGLPEQCSATLVCDAGNASRGTLQRRGHPTMTDVLVEGVSPAWARQVARTLAPLQDVGGGEDAATLPSSARLLEVMDADPPTPDGVRSRWMLEPRSTEMVVGVGLDGPFSLDLAGDGPHGLVAGMTGSGKTELLQTMIASLALANRPDAMNFVLIDYKGDSAFKDCVRLPHTVGKVNDLDSHLVKRALASLQAELKHREHVLAAAGTKDIEDYTLLQSREPDRDPLPRLLLVIDEFAQLVKDLPDFVTGLVNIAQLGRSLGIHLLLATQRPSGVVSPEIRANTNMRIALRVSDAADSSDVIGSAESSKIPKSAPGRAYARLGAASLQPFQSGRVGGRRPGAASAELPAPYVAPVPWGALGYQLPTPTRAKGEEQVGDTDLAALVAAVVEAAEAEDLGEQRRPWLPALPEQLLWHDQVEETTPVRGTVPALPLGRKDLPSSQQQLTYTFDLERDGHLFVVGSSKSGRSQVLRTLAAAVGRLCDPSDVHLYGLDCGSGALNPLTDLPHTGAVVSRTEAERAARLLGRLTAALDERQRDFAAHGYGDISEQRRNDTYPLPHLVLLLDRWEGFAPTLGEVDANGAAILRLLREGASAGVHLVVTGDRTLATNIRVFSLTENKLALRLADKDDYGSMGLRPRQLPDEVPPGRGFTTDATEVQVMLLTADEGARAQAAVIREIGVEVRARGPVTVTPFRLDALPTRLRLEQAREMPDDGTAAPAALLGAGGDELTSLWLPVRTGQAFVVAGPGRSGRSTVLGTIVDTAIDSGAQVLLVAPRPSPLRERAGREGVLAVLTDGTTPQEEVQEMVTAAASASSPVLVVVDDGEGLRDMAAGPFLAQVSKAAVEHVALVLGGDADGVCVGLSGWQLEVKKARRGMLLSPQGLGDGELIGTRMPRSALGGPVRPGLGWLHLDGTLRQVATVWDPDHS